MRRRVGESVAAGYRCFSPPVDDLSAYVELGTVEPGSPGAGLPAGGRGRPADPDRLGAAAPPGGLRRRVQADLPRHEPPDDARGLAPPGAGRTRRSDAAGLLGGDAADNPMRRTIHAAAGLLGPCWSISHLIGGPGQVFRVIAGRPESVQESLAAEARRRFRAPDGEPADVVVAGNHPWPGDPMQSFKVLLHHRAACRPGGVLVGLFWTDPAEIGRSFPVGALRRIAATGALGAWGIRHLIPAAQHAAALAGSPAAFMIRWARELVVDRDRPGLRPAPPRAGRPPPRTRPALRRPGRALGMSRSLLGSSVQWSVVSDRSEERQRASDEP